MVEDTAILGSPYVEALIGKGFGVIQAASGADAVLRARAVRPDVVVLDLSLPRLGRANTLRVLRANVRTRSIPVIALDWDLDHAARGFDRILVRPCSPQRLMDAIRELVSKSTATGR